MHPASKRAAELQPECDVVRTRRSGPGGQHRNKVETAIVLTHRPSGVGAQASERRSQAENLDVALARLRLNLALEVRSPISPDYVPSELWRSRCPRGRIVVNPGHDDFPALLAEALDVIAARDMDLKAAAELLGCTASQLTKFLKDEPRALGLVNDRRRQLGLRTLQ
jgi:hypothetical protein